MSTIAIYSVKGGVGKSTFAVNLAYQSATVSGRKTLLWDLDAQGAAGFLLNHDGQGGRARTIFSRDADPRVLTTPTAFGQLDLLAADMSLRQLDVQLVEEDARKRLRKLTRTLHQDYDVILLDCPPGMTELSEQIFRAADLIIVPVPPSQLGLRAYEEVVAHLRSHHRGGAVVLPAFSMVDRRRRLHRDMVAARPVWPSIPLASVIERMTVERAPLGHFARNHPATMAFVELWAEAHDHLSRLEGLSKVPKSA
jgi:cellulose biosynthesis protein BcsQ